MPAAAREESLGVGDRGIFSDLDAQVQIDLPEGLAPERVAALVDDARGLLILYEGDFPLKAYPLGGGVPLAIGAESLALRPGDRAELAPLLRASALRHLRPGEEAPPGDRDGDGLPDPLDLLVGAHKTAINADRYESSYVRIPYPGGDVPRDIGVCTDVVVRAARNLGLDLQAELHRDIVGARPLYPMVKAPDSSIDHRRVGTLLPYFKRHWEAHGASVGDPRDPLRPGDVVLLDTFPNRHGPDHIGVVSERRGKSGLPLVINNWTDGTRTDFMDLLGWVPVTHRFRVRRAR